MATQVSYPGIYIQEFTPGAPIQGVGTSTGAFIGTATMGPINQPTFITSWDEFQTVFGGFIAEPPNTSILNRSYLAPAVYGFFLNGGTGCYIVRAVYLPPGTTSLMATVPLWAQPIPILPALPQPDLIATAIAEGKIGNSISVTVNNSSRLAAMLAAGGPTLQATGDLHVGDPSISVTVPAALASLVLPVGTALSVTLGTTTEMVNVKTWAVAAGVGTITLATALQNAYLGTPFAQIAPALQATATLAAGLLIFNVTLPTAPSSFVLSQALPPGALIQVSNGADIELVNVVFSGSGAPGVGTITIASGLVNNYLTAPFITSLEFDLVVSGATNETWPQLSMNPINPNYWQTAVQSKLIALSLPTPPPTYSSVPAVPNPNPAPGAYKLTNGYDDSRTDDLTLGINANPTAYLNLLTPLQNVDIVAVPGNTNVNVQQNVVSYCETQFNRFAVLDGAPDSSVGYTGLQTQYGQVRTTNGFAAIYFPWIQVVNPLTAATEYWPPSGHVMGIYAQTDQQYGVYKAPANVPIAGALGLQSLLSNNDQGPLNLLGINILRSFPEQSQPLVFGARTTSTDSDWQYVNIRRLFIYLEQSIEQGIRWAIFAPNNPMLWGQLKRTINEFLGRVQTGGGIQDYYVRIDAALNPPASQALGQLYIEVGIQPTYPAEFIILRIGIWQGGSSVSES